MHPVERLLNLLALLLHARRPLTFEEIRAQIPAYDREEGDAPRRMFERDKDTLRDLGVPLESAFTDAWEVEKGYVIPRDRFYLPEIRFTPEELSALMVATQAAGAGEAEQAFQKLSAAQEERVLSALAGGPAAGGADAFAGALGVLAGALLSRRAVRFRYRSTPARGGKRRRGPERHVDPYGLVYRSGSWYLVGLDRARNDVRAYKLARFESDVTVADEASAPPEGFQASDHLRAGAWGVGEPETTAKVAFGPKVAWWAVPASSPIGEPRRRKDGWVEAKVPATLGDSFLSWVLSFGADAEVVEPPELRAAVVERLRRTVESLSETGAER